MQPLYTADNTTTAYQLNWSVALFGTDEFPPAAKWLSELKAVVESDGVRILEHHMAAVNVTQFMVSSKPHIAPSQIVRFLKGRWQYLIRDTIPKALRRNYSIGSIGEANSDVLARYVARQPRNHPMADRRVQERIEALQFHDSGLDFGRERFSSHGRFVHNLHVVLENEGGWHDTRADVLIRSRQMIIDSAKKHSWGLASIGLVTNHFHILLSTNVTESPESVALGDIKGVNIKGVRNRFRGFINKRFLTPFFSPKRSRINTSTVRH